MQRNYTIALDIDGTLIDKNGKLDPRVLGIFKNADLSKTKFILTTGGTIKSARFALSQINKALNLNENNQIKAYMCTNCGAEIFNPDGKLVYSTALSLAQSYALINTVRLKDKGSVIVYVANDVYYIEDQSDLKLSNQARFIKNDFLMWMYKKKEGKAKKGDAGLDFGQTKKLNYFKDIKTFVKENGKISSIMVAPTCSSKDKKQAIYQSLKENAGDLSVYSGFAIAIPASTKKRAIEFVLKSEIMNTEYVNNIKQVVYLGDGTNDIEMLQTANVSVARGEKAKEKAKAVAKFKLNSLEQFSKNLYSGRYDFQIYQKSTVNQMKK